MRGTSVLVIFIVAISGPVDGATARDADYNLNGEVDFQDFISFVGDFGTEGLGLPSDLDQDGKVAFGDFLVFASLFGKTWDMGSLSVSVASLPDTLRADPLGTLNGMFFSVAASCANLGRHPSPDIDLSGDLVDVGTVLDAGEGVYFLRPKAPYGRRTIVYTVMACGETAVDSVTYVASD